MPTTKVGRRQDAEGHLAAAAEYIKIAESGDAARAAYAHAADEIIAAQKDDSTLSNYQIGRHLGRSESWVRTLVRWRTTADSSTDSPFTREARRQRGEASPDDSTAKKVARERPKAFVAAFRDAPPAARKAIAKEISKAPEVRVEARRRDEEVPKRKPSPVAPSGKQKLYEFESHLVSARRHLRDALMLVAEITQPGKDQDILELLSMLKGLVEANEESYRSGQSLDDWAHELWERSGGNA
jgi:hypothetical protein